MELRTWTEDLTLRHTFTISRESQDVVRTVLIELRAEEITGIGEASPSRFYGHTPESVLASLEKVRPLLRDGDPFLYRDLLARASVAMDGDRAALCAIDLALHDWIGKKLGVPLHRLLGLDPAKLPHSSFTIGIDSVERMVEKTRDAAAFPILKVKLGTANDIANLRAMRAVTRATFRVDANCAWTPEETLSKSRELKALGVEFIEQPLKPERAQDMSDLRVRSALPLYADENAVVPEDVPGLAGRFDGIVIKLVKCGGILPALRMVEIARAVGLRIMFGCMIESSVLISAAAQIGALADHLDLDGAILITNDPFQGAENRAGRITLPTRPGLGVIAREQPAR